jgi:hypothetical protein
MYKTSKYSKAQTQEWTGRIAVILAESQVALTLEEIKGRDIVLSNITSQKISKMVGHLVEMGMATKAKNSKGLMTYKSIATI